MKKLNNASGFTLLELVVVVAVLTIMVGALVPQMGSAIKKSSEASTKGGLASLRSAITIYTSANEGQYPTDNLTSLVPVYLKDMPKVHTLGYHEATELVTAEITPTDTGTWSYNNVPGTESHGSVRVGCTHSDLNDRVWSSY